MPQSVQINFDEKRLAHNDIGIYLLPVACLAKTICGNTVCQFEISSDTPALKLHSCNHAKRYVLRR